MQRRKSSKGKHFTTVKMGTIVLVTRGGGGMRRLVISTIDYIREKEALVYGDSELPMS